MTKGQKLAAQCICSGGAGFHPDDLADDELLLDAPKVTGRDGFSLQTMQLPENNVKELLDAGG